MFDRVLCRQAYSHQEGRRLRIDGEVRLEALFSVNGQVHVMRVLQGLGYGLGEQAVKAAEQIKFKPALHESQPIYRILILFGAMAFISGYRDFALVRF